MEDDSVNYDDFKVALQNAPKGGLSPISDDREEDYIPNTQR